MQFTSKKRLDCALTAAKLYGMNSTTAALMASLPSSTSSKNFFATLNIHSKFSVEQILQMPLQLITIPLTLHSIVICQMRGIDYFSSIKSDVELLQNQAPLSACKPS